MKIMLKYNTIEGFGFISMARVTWRFLNLNGVTVMDLAIIYIKNLNEMRIFET